MIHRCDVEPEDLGPMLLDQLPPARARLVARQVAGCPSCAREAALLAPVVTALASYPPPGAVVAQARAQTGSWAPVSADGLEQVLATVRDERSRRRRRQGQLAAAAAVVLLGLATPVTLAVLDRTEPAPRAAAAVMLSGAADVTGRATLDERSWGTAIRLEADGLDPGARYGVWFAQEDGSRLPAGSFSPTEQGSVDLRLSSALPLADGRVLGVTRLPGPGTTEPVDVLTAPVNG